MKDRKIQIEHYEVSNFARNGNRSRHNLKYWELDEYIGIGPAAHSFALGKRFFYPRDIFSFLENPKTEDDGTGGDIEEEIMLALRLSAGYDLRAFPSVMPFLGKLCENGLGRLNETTFSLTDKGMAVSNTIITEILEIIE